MVLFPPTARQGRTGQEEADAPEARKPRRTIRPRLSASYRRIRTAAVLSLFAYRMEDFVRSFLTALALTLIGATTLMASPAMAQNRFWLVNNSGLTIERAYVSPTRLSNWGPDILGNSILPAGEQVRVTPSARDCVLDIRVQYEGGQEEEKRNVNACNLTRIVFTNPSNRAQRDGGAGGSIERPSGGAGGSVSGGSVAGRNRDQGDPSFNFVNRSGETIQELYVSSTQQDSWGRDHLGDRTLPTGREIWVSLPSGQGCSVDIRVVFNGGRSQERRNVPTCDSMDVSWP